MSPKIVSSLDSNALAGDSAAARDFPPDAAARETIEKRVVTDVLIENRKPYQNVGTKSWPDVGKPTL
jgi:hypothetical protein